MAAVAKKKKGAKKRDGNILKALRRETDMRPKVVPSKKRYRRKPKHPDRGDEF